MFIRQWVPFISNISTNISNKDVSSVHTRYNNGLPLLLIPFRQQASAQLKLSYSPTQSPHSLLDYNHPPTRRHISMSTAVSTQLCTEGCIKDSAQLLSQTYLHQSRFSQSTRLWNQHFNRAKARNRQNPTS